jgi:hypothetical protein
MIRILGLRFIEFASTIHSVTFDVSGDVIQDSKAELCMILGEIVR